MCKVIAPTLAAPETVWARPVPECACVSKSFILVFLPRETCLESAVHPWLGHTPLPGGNPRGTVARVCYKDGKTWMTLTPLDIE